ncbi:hypothetical protein QUC31_006400 [Theobroma cacao]
MAVSESSRLRASLEKENVPVRRLIANQILHPPASDCKFCAVKRKDQTRALDMIRNDPELFSLKLIQAPLVDMEIRGVPALKIMGDIVWKLATTSFLIILDREFSGNMKMTIHKESILQYYKSSIREARGFDIKLPVA